MSLYSKKLEEEFIEEILRKGTYANKEEIAETLKELKDLLYLNNDKSIKEIVYLLTDDLNDKVKEIVNSGYPIPGYNVEINSGIIKASVYGGVMDETNRPMTKDAIFDIASISKLFTQIISYNLIKEGYYDFDSIVSDLHPKFKNANNLDIKTIMEFAFSYTIDGNIEKSNSIEESKNILYSLGVNEKDNYKYIDFGMMCLKEVMEKVTNMSYDQLLKGYIINKLGLKNTYIEVPENKIELITGTPNANLGKNNDMKAIKLGGFGGHAGILSNSADLIKVVKNLYTNNYFFPQSKLADVYTESEYSKKADMQSGIMGNARCGIGSSFVDRLSPYNASAYQGSTRTQVNVGTYGDSLTASTILFNPASMGLKRAKEIEEKLNKKFVTEYSFEGKDYSQLAAQTIIPPLAVSKPMTHEMSKLSLKLAFINKIIDSNYKKYNEEINIEINDNVNIK